jgi:hypothetical protein
MFPFLEIFNLGEKEHNNRTKEMLSIHFLIHLLIFEHILHVPYKIEGISNIGMNLECPLCFLDPLGQEKAL